MPEDTDLLKDIAWNVLNILGADVVTIYEYVELESDLHKRFNKKRLAIAGRLKFETQMSTEIVEHNAPVTLVKHGQNVYAECAREHRIMNDPDHKRAEDDKVKPFVIREKVESSAGVLLKASRRCFGVMFINYRRRHVFSPEEKNVIETLLSPLAAIAIRNRRLLENLNAIDRQMSTTLDLKKLLGLIAKLAVEITGAYLGDIRLLDPMSQELVVSGRFPKEIPSKPNWERIAMGEGITGWVAENQESVIVNDVDADLRYKKCFPIVKSELCVPLLDKANRLLGTLNVESDRTFAFTVGHMLLLEALAARAVIAVESVENKSRRIQAEKLAAYGRLGREVWHFLTREIAHLTRSEVYPIWWQNQQGN